MGRKRKEKWEPRIIDIDILFFNEAILETEELTIPHKLLHKRRFVLEPLHDILPYKNHPVLQKSVSILLSELTIGGATEKFKTISAG
jgi:7,8-dihydro-6-hydroxymethylpterin-pyrophosphokinase